MAGKIFRGFTLIELMVVVVIIGAIAMFAIPNFVKNIRKADKDYALEQLKIIHAANQIYRSQKGNYWPNETTPTVKTLAEINSNLKLNVIAGNLDFRCIGNGSSYLCDAYYPPLKSSWCYNLTGADLDTTNPAYRDIGSNSDCICDFTTWC